MKNRVVAGSGGCFPKGALVQLEHGKTKRIEDIKLGDEVLSFDEWGNITKSVVTETHFHAEPEPLINVKYWQGEITITPNHWVLNAIKTFSAIGDLGINEALVDGFGNLRPITAIHKADPEPVYNLTVEPYHTFICDGICVHNGGYRASYPTIGGAGGGGKKKSKSKGMVEDPDNLESTSLISVLDLIGEGLIGGLVHKGEYFEPTDEDGNPVLDENGNQVRYDKSAMSIFLDDTPLMASDGSFNFDNVVYDSREGSQDQEIIEGFGDIEESVSVGEEVTKKGGGIIRTITNPNADRIRIVMSVSALTRTDNKTGDIHGSEVRFAVKCRHNTENWRYLSPTPNSEGTAGGHLIRGKTRSTYQRAYEYQLPKNMSLTANENHVWNIKVERLTDDSSSSLVANTLNWDSYSIIIESRLNYPNSALVGVTIDAENFSSVPSRSYLVKGLKIQVPRGYTPPYRDDPDVGSAAISSWHPAVYPEIWDGSFETMVCSNPAWILYDLLTDTRYGLGNFVDPEDIDIGKLYKIGKYCDELIESGYTTDNGIPFLEPRFQINTVIQQRTDAYKVISDICSAFRGMAFWSGGEIGIMADMPTQPTMVYTPANVIDGVFTYQGSARKDRHSVVLVTWNNPNQYYQQEVEYVEDPELVERYGVRETEIVDFGCTSRGQARRAGLWLLYTEKNESDLINFDVGIDSSLVMPGEVVEVHDTVRAGKRFGGRIRKISQTNAQLDSPITVDSYDGKIMLSIRMKDGTFQERELCAQGDVSERPAIGQHGTDECEPDKQWVYWAEPLPADNMPVANAIWLASSENLEPVIARVVAIKQKTSSTFTISVLEHNPKKYDGIEKGLVIDSPKTTILKFSDAGEITNLIVEEYTYEVASGAKGLKLFVNWTGQATSYIVSYRRKAKRTIETYTEVSYPLGLDTTTDTGTELTTVVTDVHASDPEKDGFTGVIVTTTTRVTRSDTGESTLEVQSYSYSEGTSTDPATGETTSVVRNGDTYTVTIGSASPKTYTIGTTTSADLVDTTVVHQQNVTVQKDSNNQPVTLTVTKTETYKVNGRQDVVTTDTKVYAIGGETVASADGSVIDRYMTYEIVDNNGVGTGAYMVETRHAELYAETPNEWVTVTTTEPFYEILNAQAGEYEISVQGVSLNGARSTPATIVHEVINTGSIATVGTPQNFKVSKRIYDLLCTWDAVLDDNVMGYEVRWVKKGGSWDSIDSVIVQSNIRASSCIDDKDEAGEYTYFLKSISVDGIYCEVPAVFDLTLVQPQSVTGFTCVQHNQRIEFRWDKNPELDVVYYEIREGDSWAASTKVVEIDATYYTLPTPSKSTDRRFWIKAVASPGIYSHNAMMAQLVCVALENRNVVWEHAEEWEEYDWHGIHYKTELSPINTSTVEISGADGSAHDVIHDLRLAEETDYGEYVHHVVLPRRYNESNYVDCEYQVIDREESRWVDITTPWNQTNRPWVITGDLNVCSVEHQISLFKGYDSASITSISDDIIEAFPLRTDQNGTIIPLSPTSDSRGIEFGDGRFLQGARLGLRSVLEWELPTVKQIGEEFFVHFWYSFELQHEEDLENSQQKKVVFQILFDDSTILSVGYNYYHKSFYAESFHDVTIGDVETMGTFGETVEIVGDEAGEEYYPEPGEKVFFGIIQEQNARTLMVGILGKEMVSKREESRTVYEDIHGAEWTDPVVLPEGEEVEFSSGTMTNYTNTYGAPLLRRELDYGMDNRKVKKFGFILSDFLEK